MRSQAEPYADAVTGVAAPTDEYLDAPDEPLYPPPPPSHDGRGGRLHRGKDDARISGTKSEPSPTAVDNSHALDGIPPAAGIAQVVHDEDDDRAHRPEHAEAERVGGLVAVEVRGDVKRVSGRRAPGRRAADDVVGAGLVLRHRVDLNCKGQAAGHESDCGGLGYRAFQAAPRAKIPSPTNRPVPPTSLQRAPADSSLLLTEVWRDGAVAEDRDRELALGRERRRRVRGALVLVRHAARMRTGRRVQERHRQTATRSTDAHRRHARVDELDSQPRVALVQEVKLEKFRALQTRSSGKQGGSEADGWMDAGGRHTRIGSRTRM